MLPNPKFYTVRRPLWLDSSTATNSIHSLRKSFLKQASATGRQNIYGNVDHRRPLLNVTYYTHDLEEQQFHIGWHLLLLNF
jgi:hypothetical protein